MIDMLLLLRLPHPHHFGYSFKIRFRVSPLRHWLILHSDFLADYYWVGDSWLVMLDSSFCCALDIHTRAYFSFFSEVPSCCWVVWLPLFMVIKMFDGFWQILYCTSDIHTRAYSPFIWLRWALSGALSLSLCIFIDLRSQVEYVEMMSTLV